MTSLQILPLFEAHLRHLEQTEGGALAGVYKLFGWNGTETQK